MKRMRKNNKGFSLVELIIVIAIMVALIAVMGPQYVKYVQSSRDAVVGDAAESVLSVVKSEFAMNNLNIDSSASHTIVIGAANGDGQVAIQCSGITFGAACPTTYSLYEVCGVDSAKTVKSDVIYTITVGVDSTTGGNTFSMVKSTGAASVAKADVSR